jgi:hypothetical protein
MAQAETPVGAGGRESWTADSAPARTVLCLCRFAEAGNRRRLPGNEFSTGFDAERGTEPGEVSGAVDESESPS